MINTVSARVYLFNEGSARGEVEAMRSDASARRELDMKVHGARLHRVHRVHRVHGGALFTVSALFTLLVAAMAGAAHDESNHDAAPAQTSCGTPGLPPCPLQQWMRSNVASQLAANNMSALATGLERSAKLAPDPAWTSWAAIASRGAEAARKGDVAGARASCKACHDAWRDAYRAKYRARPIPR